ncbi:MAG: response regulator transcription factor [Sphingomonadales bacterium]|nr:response regulator transcription factor [Sphingomonadales bacterium]MBD3771966.1 response regulator transcription factor [Paracoccaceae bacterium]
MQHFAKPVAKVAACSNRGRAARKSRLFVVMADDADAIAQIRELACSCIELDPMMSETDLIGMGLCDSRQAGPLRNLVTERQWEIALAVARGLSNKDIGRELGISHLTVRNHLSHVLRATGLSSRRELATLLREVPDRLT